MINLTVIIVKSIVDKPLNTNTATIKFGLGNVAYQTKLTTDMAHAKSMICLYENFLIIKSVASIAGTSNNVANNWYVPTMDAVPPTDLINTEIYVKLAVQAPQKKKEINRNIMYCLFLKRLL